MAKQTKKLIAIFAVMAIAMFATIKAFGEVKLIENQGTLLHYHSSELNCELYVPTGSEEDVYLAEAIFDEQVVDFGDIPGFKKTEKTLRHNGLCEDVYRLIGISGSCIAVFDSPDFKERSRVWIGFNGKYYQKQVIWKKIGE